MFNKTYNIDRSESNVNNINEAEHNLSIAKKRDDSRIIHVKQDSKDFWWLFHHQDPYLLDSKEVHYGTVFKVSSNWKRERLVYLTHGVDIVQVAKTGDDVYVEIVDVEREPTLFSKDFEIISDKLAKELEEEDVWHQKTN